MLFLTTIYFSSNPQQIFTGFAGGLIGVARFNCVIFSDLTTSGLPSIQSE